MPLEDRAKRVGEVSICLATFKNGLYDKIGVDLQYKADAASRIVSTYEILLDERIRPFLASTSKSSRYKIASGMEIATLYVLPVEHRLPGSAGHVEVNCLLAASLASHFLFGMAYEQIMKPHADKPLWDRIQAMHYNHLNCLKYSYDNELHSFPLFANATFWESYSVIIDFMHRIPALSAE